MKNKKIYILLVVSILVTIIGISLAFFTINVVGNNNAKRTKVTTGDLELVFTDNNEVSLSRAFPGDSIEKVITVTNSGSKEVGYNLVWTDLSNEIINNELVIEATCKNLNSTGTEDGTCNPISKKAVTEANIASNIQIKPGYTHQYVVTVTFIDTGKLQNYNKNKSFTGKIGITESSAKTVYCTFDGELTQGAEYVNGQYTYRYMQEMSAMSSRTWVNISNDGWGVALTDWNSTEPVMSSLCTYINDRPVVSMQNMFINSSATSINLNGFNTIEVVNMFGMFWGSKASTLDLSSFNTSNVTSMEDMFNNTKTQTLDLSSFDTSKVTDMSSMFSNSQATSINLNGFNTSNVTSMGGMFYGSQATIIDLSNFDTSKVTNMSSMFSGTQVETLNLDNFNTSNVVDMHKMFADSQTTTISGLNNFNTSNVIDMGAMFRCIQFIELDLSSFDTSNVTNMSDMFADSSLLKIIYVSENFNTNSVETGDSMFYNCTSLVGSAGTVYDSTNVSYKYAHIDGGTSNPGYFTKASAFATNSWSKIIADVKSGNISKYKVGDTKSIDMGDYGEHTVRIANTSTPSECSTEGFSQTACGFVLEFADIITTHKMNDTETNVGGWPATSMRTFVNNDIYNAIPSEIKNAIIDTTVVSGHESTSEEENFTSTDKLYLLAPKEIYTDFNEVNDTAKDLTRTLDYYTSIGVTESNYSGAIKKNGTSALDWWLRTPTKFKFFGCFYEIQNDGNYFTDSLSNYNFGVSPAFRIG